MTEVEIREITTSSTENLSQNLDRNAEKWTAVPETVARKRRDKGSLATSGESANNNDQHGRGGGRVKALGLWSIPDWPEEMGWRGWWMPDWLPKEIEIGELEEQRQRVMARGFDNES